MSFRKGIHLAPGCNGQLVHTLFPSRFVAPRTVTVWLPPGYAEKSEARYPVIYAHDGQNLFDPTISFGGVAWEVDGVLIRLTAEGVRPAIVVGIWNTALRHQEYYPQRVFETLLAPDEKSECEQLFGKPLSDLYLRFMVEELKPFVDAQYRTLPDRQNTFIMGSSFGGLISVYALCEYPEVFGAAACLSTHWPACKGKMADYLREHLPDPAQHRLYFDYGTKATDAMYEPFQQGVDYTLYKAGYIGGRRTLLTYFCRSGGYRKGRTFLSEKFRGEDHSERAWRKRVDIPLRFLLANR